MHKKIALILTYVILFGVLGQSRNVKIAGASGTIYIRADGSIDPPTANITTIDNVTYTFIDNIYESIVVERSNIMVDGAGYTLQGPGSGNGLYWTGMNNVTIRNTNIRDFYYGILSEHSSNNSFSENTITYHSFSGIWLRYSSNSNVSGNNITANVIGIRLESFSGDNNIIGNNITNNGYGIRLWASSGNSVSGNNITNNTYGIVLIHSSNYNVVSGNKITNNFYGIIFLHYSSSSYNSVSGNNITNNSYGIYLEYYCNYNNFSENNIINNTFGIRLRASSNHNSINGNNIILNKDIGIRLEASSSYNSFSENNIANNSDGIAFGDSSSYNVVAGNNITANSKHGVGLFSSSNYNSVSGNNITNNNDGIWLYSSSSNSVSGNNITNSFWGIRLEASSSYNSFSENNITNNGYGILLSSSSSNSVSGNNITNNTFGIYLEASSNYNNVSGNTMKANNYFGIWLRFSFGSRFYHNNFIDNYQQVSVYPSGYANVWDDGYPSGGNYWSNYTGEDMCCGQYQNLPGSDDLGDTPHIIDADNRDNYPLVKPWSWAPHDIALQMATLSKNIFGQGYTIHTNVTVKNQGDYTETFNITVHANTTLLQTFEDITLTSGNSITITVTWNTTYFAKGNYTISVAADHVPGEINTNDNTFTYGWILVTILGDVNGDKKVNMRDISAQGRAFGTTVFSPSWDPNMDLNEDGIIDMRDIGMTARNFDQSW